MIGTKYKPNTEKLLELIFGDIRLYIASNYVLLTTPKPI
jgi:hypothetical protein